MSRTFSLALALAILALGSSHPPQPVTSNSYIVEGPSLEAASSAVLAVEGEITHELGIIDSVAANVTPAQVRELQNIDGIRISANTAVETAGRPNQGPSGDESGGTSTDYPVFTEANRLHQQGITGWGVGVAVLDSGSLSHVSLNKDSYGSWRFFAQYDAVTDEVVAWADRSRKKVGVGIVSDDESGHGTHVQSVIVSSATGGDGSYNGIAPDAHLVSVKAFDANGQGSYADVIRGIEWIVNNRFELNIRVLNLSLSAAPQSHYWDDPLNRAVMRAWEAGIVVVASAGNTGPNAMSIGVPGNVPYVITVGAMTDSFTPGIGNDDALASFSAVGPTAEGFVKPEIVAPGGHIVGLMNHATTIATQHPEYHDGGAYFTMSGTSQAASVVSGIAALVLQAEPALTPAMVKCKIMSSARPAVDDNGDLAYSVFQQGAGMVNAYDAVYSWNYDCANRGLDIAADLAGTRHFGGRASVDEYGNYYIMGLDGYQWTDGSLGTDGYVWTNGYQWTDGYLWTDGYQWTDGTVGANGYVWTNGYQWTDGLVLTDGYQWTDGFTGSATTESMSINHWVDQE